MTMAAAALVGVGGFASTSAAAPTAAAPAQATARAPRTAQGRAVALLNKASNRVSRTVRGCSMRRQVPTPRVTVTDGTPDPELLRVLGVLRREPTAEELHQPVRRVFLPSGDLKVYSRYTRIIHGPNDFVTTINVAFGRQSVPVLFLQPCQRHIDETLTRLLRDEPAKVRRLAIKYRRNFRLGEQTRRAFPWLVYNSGGAGTGGPFDLHRFLTHGVMIEGGGIVPPPPGFDFRDPDARRQLRHHYEVSGLVPDGVATVTLQLPPGRRAAWPPDEAGRRITPYTDTVTVHENAFGFHLPESPMGAKMRLIWRDDAGKLIRVVR